MVIVSSFEFSRRLYGKHGCGKHVCGKYGYGKHEYMKPTKFEHKRTTYFFMQMAKALLLPSSKLM